MIVEAVSNDKRLFCSVSVLFCSFRDRIGKDRRIRKGLRVEAWIWMILLLYVVCMYGDVWYCMLL